MTRCINIDWAEIYALEPADRAGREGVLSAKYFTACGYNVVQRNYGTPIYEEMFTIYAPAAPDVPFVEIRRKPRKNSQGGTFLPPTAAHLRLSNIMCYTSYPLQALGEFMFSHNYSYQSIKRIDLCLDFNTFDTGGSPAIFIADFLANKYAKINQCNIHMHGVDGWDGRQFNSIKWGSEASNLTTKLYNKTKEMKETRPKTYIQESWHDAGLNTLKDVWRVEFSIKAGRKGFKNVKTQEFYKMKIGTFADRNRLLFIFNALLNQYFHFKKIEMKADGTRQRKDRCHDKILFKIGAEETAYKPANIVLSKDLTRTDVHMMKRLQQWARDESKPEELRDAANMVAEYIYENTKIYVGY